MSFYFLKIPFEVQQRETICVVKMDVGKMLYSGETF